MPVLLFGLLKSKNKPSVNMHDMWETGFELLQKIEGSTLKVTNTWQPGTWYVLMRQLILMKTSSLRNHIFYNAIYVLTLFMHVCLDRIEWHSIFFLLLSHQKEQISDIVPFPFPQFQTVLLQMIALILSSKRVASQRKNTLFMEWKGFPLALFREELRIPTCGLDPKTCRKKWASGTRSSHLPPLAPPTEKAA